VLLALCFGAVPTMRGIGAEGYRSRQLNDPNFSTVTVSNDWAFTRVHAQEAWQALHGATQAVERVVAVIDEATDMNHVELQDHLWVNQGELGKCGGVDDDHNGFVDDFHGWDFVGRDNSPTTGFLFSRSQHGTLVAGLVVADHDNGVGIVGMAPNARIMLLRWHGSGMTLKRKVTALSDAVTYALNNDAHIINLSGGIPLVPSRPADQSYLDKLDLVFRKAWEQGVLVVCAAGNLGGNLDDQLGLKFWAPAMFSYENIICVTGSSPQPEKRVYAWGTNSVDIAAPGFNIYGPVPKNRFAWSDGSSFATPLVSGAAALVWGMMPKLKASEVRCLLLSTARPLPPANVVAGEEWGYTPPAKPNSVLDLSFVTDAYDAYLNGTPYHSCFPANVKDRVLPNE